MSSTAIILILLSTNFIISNGGIIVCTHLQDAHEVRIICVSVRVEFDQRDRQVPENAGPCNVALVKTGKLQEDLIIRVRALTIEKYENETGYIFPFNVAHVEGNFPQKSYFRKSSMVNFFLFVESDFDSSYEQLFMFEANGGLTETKPVAVSVVDDNVNEANEEFLLFVEVVGPLDSVAVTTQNGRNPVRCRIMNDDGKSKVRMLLIHCA